MQPRVRKLLGSDRTLDQAMREQPKGAAGFDHLRLYLAFAVLLTHVVLSPWIDAPQSFWDSPFGALHRSLLPMFFALSGFLVTGSLMRNSVPRFLALRAIRIAPALVVEVTLSAVLIGMTFTTLPLSEYLVAPQFHTYFLNMLGIVQYELPGVFEGRAINGQLWTLPFEFKCYAALSVLALIGFVKQRRLFAIVVLMLPLMMTAFGFQVAGMHTGPAVPGMTLVLTFLSGVVLYLFKDKVALSPGLMVAAMVASYVTLDHAHLIYLTSLPTAYVTVWLGLQKAPKLPVGDLSYGIYLFHFPIQRMVFELSGRTMSWAPLLVCTVPLTLACAYVSWRFVEQPTLRRKAVILAGLDAVWQRLCAALPRGLRANVNAG